MEVPIANYGMWKGSEVTGKSTVMPQATMEDVCEILNCKDGGTQRQPFWCSTCLRDF